MHKRNQFILLVRRVVAICILSAVGLMSCGPKGAAGPAGPEGPAGPGSTAPSITDVYGHCIAVGTGGNSPLDVTTYTCTGADVIVQCDPNGIHCVDLTSTITVSTPTGLCFNPASIAAAAQGVGGSCVSSAA